MRFFSNKEKEKGIPGRHMHDQDSPNFLSEIDEESENAGITTGGGDGNGSPPQIDHHLLHHPVKPGASPVAGCPNGGLKAWLQVLGSFFIYFNTWGLVASFGAFQAYYEDELLKENSPFAISTIGSLQSFLMVFLGFIAGPVFDLGYARQLLWLGSLLIVVGTVAQSLSSTLGQLLLSQGLCVGVGMGCLAVLGVAVLAPWFTDTKLPVATGIAAAGSGVGGLILPIILRSLQPNIGFRWTVRTMALIALSTLAISLVSMHTPKASAQRRAWIDRSAFRDVPYLLFVCACCLVFLGIYTPFVYVQKYALLSLATESETAGMPDNGSTSSSSVIAMYLLSILNGASILGRTIPNVFAARIGAMNMLVVAVLIMSVSAFCLMAAVSSSSVPGLVVVVALYGFSSGSFFSLQPTTFTQITQDRRYIGTRLGMAYSVMSVALLLGAPVGGALVRRFGYASAWIWAGVCLSLGSVMTACSRGVAKFSSLHHGL